jgi:hypothetical protein
MQLAGLLVSHGPRANPFEIRREIIEKFQEIPERDRKIFLEIGLKFYRRFHCNREGKLGEYTSFKKLEELL